MKQTKKTTSKQKEVDHTSKDSLNNSKDRCDSCPVFASFTKGIADYHKLKLELLNQMVRNLCSSESINLN